MKKTKQADIHQIVTDQIIAAIEAGTSTFQMPWMCNNGLPIKAASGDYYQGINIITLWAQAQTKGYTSNLWGGFAYFKKQGGHVRKGEKSTKIIKFSIVERENKTTGQIDNIPKVRALSVFNRDQIDGLPEIEQEEITNEFPIVTTYGDQVLAMAEKLGAKVEIKGNRAYYTPATDSITMPERKLFIERERCSADVGFASTLCHELAHFTGHESRLDRDLQVSNKAQYAFEELVAEISAGFLCAELGFDYDGVDDHASYIASWLKALKNDNRMIFKAAAQATEAVNYIMQRESKHRNEIEPENA